MTTQTAQKVATKKTAPKTQAKKAAGKSVKLTKAKAPRVNIHAAAGIDSGVVGGITGLLNAERKAQVKVVEARDPESENLSSIRQKAIYTLRKHYAGKTFPCKGLDNGIVRDLAAFGLISLSGGAKATIDGAPYLVDGATPLVAKVTAAGQAYGKT